MLPIAPVQADSPFLSAILAALRKRSRALKHRNIVPAVERVVEVANGNALERIEITFISRKRQSLTIIVWEDRSLWVHACEAITNAGWNFQFTDRGRYLGGEDGRALIEAVEAVEASLSAMFEMTTDDVGRLAAIWNPRLAKGPSAA